MLPTREITFTNTLTFFGNFRLYANLDYRGGHYQWCAMCSVRNRVDRKRVRPIRAAPPRRRQRRPSPSARPRSLREASWMAVFWQPIS